MISISQIEQIISILYMALSVFQLMEAGGRGNGCMLGECVCVGVTVYVNANSDST